MDGELVTIYELSPRIYDEYMSTPMETRIFDVVFDMVRKAKNPKGPTRILDLCCGTGIFPREWLAKLDNVYYVGVDLSEPFLEFAAERMKGHPNYKFVLGDACEASLGERFDIAVSTSAYHHIEDARKREFLSNKRNHLTESGLGVIYEKLLAPFDMANKAETKRRGIEFYSERMKDMLMEGDLTDVQLFALTNEAYLTAIRDGGEFKVTYDYLVKDLESAGFSMQEVRKLWPNHSRLGNDRAGDFIIRVRKRRA